MKAVIFDFDGTLADTLPVCFLAFETVFKKFDNREVTTEEIIEMFGPSETGIIRKNLKNNNYDEAIELYYEIYQDQHSNIVQNNEEIKTLLEQLKTNGYKLGIVTGKARRSLDISLDCLGLNTFFDVIITGDDVEFQKPNPEGIYKALENLNVSHKEAVFLGDSEADIIAGKEASVTTIGVQWLPNIQTIEFKTQPDEIYSSMKGFLRFLSIL
ncbi:HAD family hydrolase (plasmid) [Cytobacillus oceanisediminis]|uniref:HAD family hydrolase n=1 Tax=Cytobacillus oceanisediminis TaxID=665099 RepID=UPI001863D61D|nr:HAD family hydrolase [Cytobacillus oceanisediminis]QOK30106.1 HAD family hydrolase [Cytobacillus oceanisediminis]